MKQVSLVLTIVLVVVALGGGFFVGMKYEQSSSANQQNQRVTFFRGADGQNAPFGQFGQRNGINGRPVRGEIISSDEKSLTVKLADGSSKIVLLGDNTSIIEATPSSKENLKTGAQVLVMGSENSDGSVTAQNIQLNPQFRQPQP